MPDDALPQPRTSIPGTVRLRREYRDSLGRPMAGTVTLTPWDRPDTGDLQVMPVPVPVPLVGGVLDVNLPPGKYTYVADLASVEGHKAHDENDITLPA